MAHGFALAARSPNGAHAVALGVDPPPAEVGVEPLGGNGIPAFAGEALDLRVGGPRVELSLETLGALRLGLLDCLAHVLLHKEKAGRRSPLRSHFPAFVFGFDLCLGLVYPVYMSGTATHALQ